MAGGFARSASTGSPRPIDAMAASTSTHDTGAAITTATRKARNRRAVSMRVGLSLSCWRRAVAETACPHCARNRAVAVSLQPFASCAVRCAASPASSRASQCRRGVNSSAAVSSAPRPPEHGAGDGRHLAVGLAREGDKERDADRCRVDGQSQQAPVMRHTCGIHRSWRLESLAQEPLSCTAAADEHRCEYPRQGVDWQLEWSCSRWI